MQTKKLKLFDLLSIGIGSVVGAGIFSMLAFGIATTGRSIWLALIFSMIIVFLQQIRSLFTASMFALDGGLYSQQALVLPPVFSGVTSIIFVVSNLTFSVFGISISDYLCQLVPALVPVKSIIAGVIITMFFLISAKGTGFLAKVQNIMAICMYLALILFVAFGIGKVQPAGFESEPFMISGIGGFMMAIAIMSYTCNGASNIINLSADTENPKKNIPLAFVLTTLICAGIYALLGYVAGGVMPFAQASQTSLGGIAQSILPHYVYLFFIIGGAMFALATSLLGGIAAISAPIVAGAEDGWLPKFFIRKTKTGYPWAVMLLMYIVAVVPAVFNFSLDVIVSFILVPGMVVGIVSNIKSFKLPKQFPQAWNNCSLKCPYWVYVTLIVVSIIASLITAVFSMLGLNMYGIIGNISITAFLFIYATYRHKKGYITMNSIKGIKDGD